MTLDDEPDDAEVARRWTAGAVFMLAVAAPLLLAPSSVPDAVFYNQAAAALGWGAVLAGAWWPRPARPSLAVSWYGIWPVLAALGGLALVALGSQAAAACVLAAALVVVAASQAVGQSDEPLLAMGHAWWIAGGLSAVIAAVQYFAPSLADGWLVAASGTAGRAVGNMRQPNHLATALLCAIVWTAWLWRVGRLRPWLAGGSITAMVFAVALSASRTGALSLSVLLAWAVVDRSLPRAARRVLAFTPLAYLVFWALLAAWAQFASQHFYAADRLQSSADISSSRFAIWKNAAVLIAQNPWTGVGWGNFNFAWTFTPFPDRPVAFFDHTHNLPLQLAVEIGVPATLAVLGLVGWALWRARGAWASRQAMDAQHPGRAAFVMLVVLGVHSLLEYPLWYAYFLLPAAWAMGLFIGSAPRRSAGDALSVWPPRLMQAAAALMIIGALYAAWDHRRIEVIFSPPADAAPLAERIERGQRSLLFGHHADYAAVTTPPRDQRLATFHRPVHQLVDVRLLIATIEALKANGRDAEALYAAQRLREFRRPDAQAYFKNCDTPEPPWQCNTQSVPLTWRDIDRVLR
ncbi:Wzy polymerase domain-containing protein [Caldimonas sp. KR1-144]|uniref:PglL family O-oligosaccharyltransferase n=1 Tax=Caldimonas sp. KR1-144 TaxID=3400911 RepID=UPI003C0A3EFB